MPLMGIGGEKATALGTPPKLRTVRRAGLVADGAASRSTTWIQ